MRWSWHSHVKQWQIKGWTLNDEAVSQNRQACPHGARVDSPLAVDQPCQLGGSTRQLGRQLLQKGSVRARVLLSSLKPLLNSSIPHKRSC